MGLREKCVAIGYLLRDSKDVKKFAELIMGSSDRNEKDKYMYFIETRVEMMRRENSYVEDTGTRERIASLIDDIETSLFSGAIGNIPMLAGELEKIVKPIYEIYVSMCPAQVIE